MIKLFIISTMLFSLNGNAKDFTIFTCSRTIEGVHVVATLSSLSYKAASVAELTINRESISLECPRSNGTVPIELSCISKDNNSKIVFSSGRFVNTAQVTVSGEAPFELFCYR